MFDIEDNSSRNCRLLFWGGLSLVFILALYLRFTGIEWGIPSAEFPHVPFHPDEDWVMKVLRSVSFTPKNWSPLEAYREGVLMHHLWLLLALFMKGVGILTHLPHEIQLQSADYGRLMWAGRCLNVLLDTASIGVIGLIVSKITKGNRLAVFIATLIFALFPFEVIYAHYLRPHAASNFFALLVVYACLFLKGQVSSSPAQIRRVGCLLGIAVAARYTSIYLCGLPALVFFAESYSEVRGNLKTVFQAVGAVF